MIIIKKSYHKEKTYNDGTTAYNDKPTAFNDKPTAYYNGTTAYNNGTTAVAGDCGIFDKIAEGSRRNRESCHPCMPVDIHVSRLKILILNGSRSTGVKSKYQQQQT